MWHDSRLTAIFDGVIGANGTPIELATAFLREFCGFPVESLQALLRLA
jgi:hypothetical protein